jgi:hypothetical protein
MKDYPHSAYIIRQAAMKIAMQRAIVVVSEYMKLNREKRQPKSPSGGEMLDALRQRQSMVHGEDAEIDGASIIPMMTGKPLKTLAQLEQEEAAQAVKALTGEDEGSSDGGVATKAILARLDRQDAERNKLAAEVHQMKGTLDKVLTLLQSSPV